MGISVVVEKPLAGQCLKSHLLPWTARLKAHGHTTGWPWHRCGFEDPSAALAVLFGGFRSRDISNTKCHTSRT
jgi:hypothetical protein